MSKALRKMYFSILPLLTSIIFSFGSIFMATSRKSASRNGTRASTPQAIVDLIGSQAVVDVELGYFVN